jgi:DNA-binding transcriptional MerR regulator
MAEDVTFTLKEIARRLDVPQHRLIHLCEKGVVVPEVHDAEGRGSSRVFSARNFLELAAAVRLRDMMLPVAAVGAIIHVLRAFETRLRQEIGDFSLADSLRGESAPELTVIIGDGRELFFSLGGRGGKARLFGGVPLDAVNGGPNGWDGQIDPIPMLTGGSRDEVWVGGPEGSHYGRLELSVTAVAQSLDLSK